MSNIEPGDKLLAEIVSTGFAQAVNWVYDDYDVWNLRFTHDDYEVHAWITQRPHYCDRGHYLLMVNIIKDREPWGVLDPQDGFPRYYMDFETAKEECEKFLIWRILKLRYKQ